MRDVNQEGQDSSYPMQHLPLWPKLLLPRWGWQDRLQWHWSKHPSSSAILTSGIQLLPVKWPAGRGTNPPQLNQLLPVGPWTQDDSPLLPHRASRSCWLPNFSCLSLTSYSYRAFLLSQWKPYFLSIHVLAAIYVLKPEMALQTLHH